MSLKRFKIFLGAARFDDKNTRKDRQTNDKLAAIRDVFDKFVLKCTTLYRVSPYTCVDESLLDFRGRCSFRVYMPSKPAKYGLKVWALCDNGTYYAGNLQVYLGKQGNSVETEQGARVVKDLTRYINGSGRNITMDNFFTSYALAKYLLQNNLTLLGTIRKNRKEIPKELHFKKSPEYRSVFAFTEDATMVTYAPKKNKSVTLPSTMHNQPDVDEDNKRKPIIILDYNTSKAAVDIFDKEIGSYSCSRKTRRWPMRIFLLYS